MPPFVNDYISANTLSHILFLTHAHTRTHTHTDTHTPMDTNTRLHLCTRTNKGTHMLRLTDALTSRARHAHLRADTLSLLTPCLSPSLVHSERGRQTKAPLLQRDPFFPCPPHPPSLQSFFLNISPLPRPPHSVLSPASWIYFSSLPPSLAPRFPPSSTLLPSSSLDSGRHKREEDEE